MGCGHSHTNHADPTSPTALSNQVNQTERNIQNIQTKVAKSPSYGRVKRLFQDHRGMISDDLHQYVNVPLQSRLGAGVHVVFTWENNRLEIHVLCTNTTQYVEFAEVDTKYRSVKLFEQATQSYGVTNVFMKYSLIGEIDWHKLKKCQIRVMPIEAKRPIRTQLLKPSDCVLDTHNYQHGRRCMFSADDRILVATSLGPANSVLLDRLLKK